jgi:hypothetical protein
VAVLGGYATLIPVLRVDDGEIQKEILEERDTSRFGHLHKFVEVL